MHEPLKFEEDMDSLEDISSHPSWSDGEVSCDVETCCPSCGIKADVSLPIFAQNAKMPRAIAAEQKISEAKGAIFLGTCNGGGPPATVLSIVRTSATPLSVTVRSMASAPFIAATPPAKLVASLVRTVGWKKWSSPDMKELPFFPSGTAS